MQEKELALKEYNSLKHTYEFFKARVSRVKPSRILIVTRFVLQKLYIYHHAFIFS